MTLVPCDGCGFVKVAGKLCACCIQDARRRPHQLTYQESHLTERPTGGYVHAARVRCSRCGEDFYLVTNSFGTQIDTPEAARAGKLAGQGLKAMIDSSPCKGA